MEPKTYTSQTEPAEGSREVVDRELKRQAAHGEPGKDDASTREGSNPTPQRKTPAQGPDGKRP